MLERGKNGRSSPFDRKIDEKRVGFPSHFSNGNYTPRRVFVGTVTSQPAKTKCRINIYINIVIPSGLVGAFSSTEKFTHKSAKKIKKYAIY